MTQTDVLGEALASLGVVDESGAVVIPAQTKRKAVTHDKRKAGRTGRAAFAADTCELHGGTLAVPCSKFGHLPGRGVGIYQPPVWRVVASIGIELVKPLAILAFLVGAIFVINTAVHGGGFLQSRNAVQPAECTMPDGSVRATSDTVLRRELDGTCRIVRGTGVVHPGPSVAPTPAVKPSAVSGAAAVGKGRK